jgi:L-ascorbate metabolism protein UlaG (beta-lactamase superfamily)
MRRWLRRFVGLLLTLVGLAAGLVAALGYLFSAPGYRGQASDHFDGKQFHNMKEGAHEGLGAFLRWQWTRDRGPWAERALTPGAKPPAKVDGGGLRVTFINHATMLIQQDGVNVLTDPIWSDRASPVGWVGPHRFHAPGLRFEDLPRIDAVLISHNHYDHLDMPTLRRLRAEHSARFFVGLGNRALLEPEAIGPTTEVDWWQEVKLNDKVTITGVPAQHFSSRGLFDRDETLWLGYVVRGPAGITYVAGDTGAGPHFAAVAQRIGKPRLALLPLGAFRPTWFMSRVHVSPDEAVDAHEQLGAGTSVGMHFGTFALGDDGQDEPVKALEAALAKRPTPPRFWTLQPGEGRAVPPSP